MIVFFPLPPGEGWGEGQTARHCIKRSVSKYAEDKLKHEATKYEKPQSRFACFVFFVASCR